MEEPVTRVDWAMARLSRAILTGTLAPGQRIKVPELAEEWSLSPTPLREALQRLAALGLVETNPNRGMHVAPIVEQEVREVYSLRLLLEPLALRLSLEHRDDVWRAHLESTFADLRAQLEAGTPDLTVFEDKHSAFHAALLDGCDSKWLIRLIRMLYTHAVRYRLLALGPRGGTTEVLEEHQALYEACLGDDIDHAVMRLFEHIRLTVEALSCSTTASELSNLTVQVGRHIYLQEQTLPEVARAKLFSEPDDASATRTA